ncbi:transmembrane protein, putative (macronuclear) [Tetrahymena thermophila SB210]|uniref:Transmembrane protein, putative n=1 Tax=Tetrahymena thermophila (strain SB210) TaxID=312017 RepID=Q22P60_TETTS|nr:transmembrane protein, putative [Tetrahymena thermophila SB210]EAR86951.2 transmembrane protein, putative [Tetrahymena thermophila SB210]|eukprot:XP_001007196.2 transmembrane protein, putative [Tetrahymena thermophila SB210]
MFFLLILVLNLIYFAKGDAFDSKIYCKIDEYQISFKECRKCDFQCLSCIGPTAKDCLKCRFNRYKNECLDKCPQNYFSQNGQCKTCSILYCQQCFDVDQCQTCVKGFKLSDNRKQCIYQSQNSFAYRDENKGDIINDTIVCQDQYATNYSGKYCQAIPFCLKENFINQLKETCFNILNKNSNGIKMATMKESVVYYNEKQANIYRIKDYQYEDSLQINDKLVKIVYFKQQLFILYTTFTEIYEGKPLSLKSKIQQPKDILNVKKSYIFSLESFQTVLLTITAQNDEYIIQDLQSSNILAKSYVGQLILDIKVEQTQNVLVLATLQTVQFFQLKVNDELSTIDLVYKASFPTNRNSSYIIQNVYTQFYYSQSQSLFALLFDEQRYSIYNIKEFKIVYQLNLDSYNQAIVIQELGQVSFHYENLIVLHDLDLIIYKKQIKLHEIVITGNNFLIVYLNPYVYIASKDFTQSYVSVYDNNFIFVKNIALKQGKVTSMHIRQPTNDEDKETVVVGQEDNIAEIQGLQVKRYLVENCFNSPVKFFGQTTTLISGYVVDQIRRIHFYVSINIYGNLVFILIKDNKVIKYVEIFHPELMNLELYQKLKLYINQVDREIKVFGLRVKDMKYVIMFSYFQFNVLFIEQYLDILFLSSSLIIVQNLNNYNQVIYKRNDFQQNSQVILSNTNSIGNCLQNNNYFVIENFWINNQNQQENTFIAIEKQAFTFCYGMKIPQEYLSINFISDDEILCITNTHFLTYNLSDCQQINSTEHLIQSKIRDVQVKVDYNLLILDEYIEIYSENEHTKYNHTYYFFNLKTFQIINQFKPLKSVNQQLEDFNQLNTYIFFVDGTHKFADSNILIVMASYNEDQKYDMSNDDMSTGLCEMYISEFIINGLKIEQSKIYTTIQECKSMSRWGEQHFGLYRSVQLFQQKIFGQIQEQFSIGCSFNCMELQEVLIYKNLVVYQEKILPNFARILSGDTLFYSKQKIIKRYNIYPKFNIIMIEYSTQLDQADGYLINIQLIKYPQNEELFNYQINQVCKYFVANIIEIYNTLIICDQNILSVYDVNNISSKIQVFNDFNLAQICKFDYQFINVGSIKGDFLAQCKLAFSEYSPIIYINGQGIYNYQNNSFTAYPQLIFDIFKVERSVNNFFGSLEQKQLFIEQENQIIVILYQTIFFYNKSNNYTQYQTTLKLNSQNYFFEQNYFITLNEHQNYEILQIYNYLFESIISFQEAENIEFSSQYYIDCTGFNKMLITYTMKIVGFNQPFSQSNDPFFTYNVQSQYKNFNVQLCTDEHLILLVNLTSTNMPRYEIQVISYYTQSLIKTYSIRPDQLIFNNQSKSVTQQNWYQKSKGIALIQNIIISLIEDGSDLLYVLPTLDFVYDDVNDYGIIIDNKNNNYIQVIDFSLIFPFNLNSYSFANDIMIGPYLYGYTNKTTNQYQNKWIIFYNSYYNSIFFYDFDDETETKLQLDDGIIQNNHQILYNIELRTQSEDVDPEKNPDFPTESLIKKLNFACLFNNYAVIFSKEKIIQYLPITNYDKNIPEGSLKFNDISKSATFARIQMNNITHLYEVVYKHVNLPTNIDLGKILHTVFYSQDLLLYLAFIDSNGYFVVDENVFIKLPEDYSVDKINLFDIIVNDKTAQSIFILGTSQKISIYNESLDKLLEMDTLSGSIQDAILEEKFQYLLLITSNTLMVYRYTLNEEKSNINQIEPLNKFNLQSRNQNKLSKINNDHIAVISKSQLSMFLLTSDSVQYIYSIQNQNFNIIQNSLLFDDSKFLIIWDVHRVYLYDVRPDNGEIVQIFYREYTHIKILYTGYYWDNNRSFIRLIGVTATNVFDIRKEVKNLDKNAEQQIQYQKLLNSDSSLKSLSSQCIQVDNLYSNILEQSQQIDYLVQKSHSKIYSIIFNVQYDNQIIQIPEKSYLENLIDGLKLIYNLNNKNIKIFQNNKVNLQNPQLFQYLTFKNGTVDLYVDQDSHQSNQTAIYNQIIFNNFNTINLLNILIKRSTFIIMCKNIYINKVTIDEKADKFVIIGEENTQNYLYIQNFVIFVQEMNKNFLQIEKYFQANMSNIFIQSSSNQRNDTYQNDGLINIIDSKIRSFTGFVNFEKVGSLNLTGLKVSDLASDITLLSIIEIENVTISDVTATNLNWLTTIPLEKSADRRISIFDIFLALNFVNISRVQIKNCMYDRVIKINSTIFETYDYIQQVQFSKNLTVNIEDVTIRNIKPKGTAKAIVAYYNLFQLQVSHAFLSNFVAKNVSGFTSCYYLQKMQQAFVKNFNISLIQNAQNIISFSQIEELNFYNIQVINFTNIVNCFYLQDSQIQLSKIKIINPIISNYYVFDSAIKISFYYTSSSILIQDTIVQNIQNQRGNGTAINIINANQVKLQNVKLNQNFCILNGGAIYAINSNILIYQLEVTDNKAVLSGGGIYLLMSQIELDKNFKDHDIKKSVIKNNFAQVGGGIRYISNFIPNLILENESIISDNSVRFYGSDYTMYPKKIQIIKDQNYQLLSSSLLSIKQKVKFIWVDEQGNNLKYYDENDTVMQLFNLKVIDEQFTDLIQELKQYKIINIYSDDIIFDSISNQIELNGAIKKNEDEGYQYIEVESSFLLSPKQKSSFYIYAPLKYIPMSLKADITNLSLPVDVEFRECIEGEIIEEYQNSLKKKYFSCNLCSNNTYSLQKPISKDQKCQICPDYSLSCEGNQIIAMQGFWNEPGTDIIEECFNQPLKCTRDDPNLYQCSEGGFGPRCESCDYSNFIFQDYYYGKSGRYNCSKFEKRDGFAKEIVITVFLVLIFSVYQGFSVIKINKQMSNQLRMYYLKKAGIINFQVTLSKSGFSSLVKFFVGYFQMLQVLLQFRFKIPDGFISTITFIGNPLETCIYSLDFAFIKLGLHKSIEIVYLRLIWLYINSFAYFILAVILSSIYICIKKRKYKTQKILKIIFLMIYTAGMYVYYSVYLNLVEIIVNIISCQSIGTKYYILADSQFECQTPYHILYAYKISLPVLVIITIVFPSFIFYKLYKQRLNLYKVSFYLKFGFFFQEYQPKKYYWEIIRMSYRTLIYVASTYFSQQQLFRSVILSLLSLLYLVLTNTNQPYRTKIQNKLDFMVAFIMIICYQLGVINNYTHDQKLQVVSVILVAILNIGIILFFLHSILREKILFNQKQFFYPAIQFLIKWTPKFFGRIFREQKSCIIFHKGWKKVQHIVFENKLPLLRLKLNLQSLPTHKMEFSPSYSQAQINNQLVGQYTTKNQLPTQLELLKINSNFSNHDAIVINTLNSKPNINTPQKKSATKKQFNFFSDSFEANKKIISPTERPNINFSSDINLIFSSRQNMNQINQPSEKVLKFNEKNK